MFLLVYQDDYERAIKPVSPVPLCQIGSRPTFDVKLRNVLSRARPPRVLLLTTDCGSRLADARAGASRLAVRGWMTGATEDCRLKTAD